MLKYLSFLAIIFLVTGCHATKISERNPIYQSENLVVQKIADQVYQHITYLNSETFGKVTCNGMIAIDGNEAIIFDTPADDKTSLELINWVEANLNCKIKAIIPTHFHADCLGGLNAFHQHGIASYANNLTIKLAQANNAVVPQNGFNNLLELKAGNKIVMVEFFGEGHTKDNVIGYLPADKIMFGGCLIKETGAGKGNLADANVKAWPITVTKLKAKYSDTKVVIPGHGKTGSTELLDYTIKLFESKQ